MSNDQSHRDDASRTPTEVRLDELGRRAGAAYRKDAPEATLAEFERRRDRQRNIRAALVAGSASVLIVAGVLVFSNRDGVTTERIGSDGSAETTVDVAPTTVAFPVVPTTPIVEARPTPSSVSRLPSNPTPTTLPISPAAEWFADYTPARRTAQPRARRSEWGGPTSKPLTRCRP